MVIRGHPGAGNTLCMLYNALYSISKGFYSTGTSSMCHRSLQIGTQHCHLILCLCGNKDNVKNPYHLADISVRIIRRISIVEYFLKILHVIIADEFLVN